MDVAEMRVPDGACDTTVCDNPADDQRIDVEVSQDVFEARLVEGRIGDLFYGEIGRRQFVDEAVAKPSRCEVAFAKKRAKLLQM